MSATYPQTDPAGHHQRASWLRRTGLAVSLAALLLGASCGTDVDTSAGDRSTTTESDEAFVATSPPRELTTGVVDDDTISIVEEYRIDGDQLTANGDTPIPAGTRKAWDRFAELFPSAGRPEVVLFVGIDQDESNGTDGALQVSALDDDQRYLALDVSGAVELKELTRTMIHEYAHLLQFRPSALTPGTEDELCDVYDGGEACPKAGSYLRLWSEAFYPDVTDGDDYPEEEADIEERYSPDEHVTDNYAATNPAEDMAETFAEWVLLNAPTGPEFVNEDPHYDAPITGDSVVDQKLRFFDQFPELLALRTSIRNQLGLDQLAVPAAAG